MCNFYLCCKFLKWFNLFVFSFWVVLKNITSAPSTTSVPIPTLQQCSEVPISTNVIYHKLCTIILPYYNTISVFFVQPDVDSNIRSLTFCSTSSPLGLNAIAANFLLFIARLLSLSHSLALIPFGKKKQKKTEYWFKHDFQSALHTLESFLAIFVLFHVRHHKMEIFCNYLIKLFQSFKTIATFMDAKRSKLYASFFLVSLDEITSQL